MLITPFNKAIVFRVTNELSSSVESIIKKWIDIDNEFHPRNKYFLEDFYKRTFPLQWPTLYIFSIIWADPCVTYVHNSKRKFKFYFLDFNRSV